MKRLLLVEDDPILRRNYHKRLKARFNISVAASFSEAMYQLCTFEFDIVLTDIHLTKAQKAEGLHIIGQASSKFRIQKIIAMSTDTEKSGECLKAGADRFLDKPFDLELVI
ncbi:MAG: response regulator [Pseudobacteriovorax sp.]|nr:response regulator [Pseudobacteriovorax sp.]NRA68630.1 response regulator [Pseudobacteriovorax sp.]